MAAKVLKILGILVLIVVALGAIAYLWAKGVATRRYQTMWTAHDATFPIPYPLDPATIDSLRKDRHAAGAPDLEPLAGVDLHALALERAQQRGQHLVESRLACDGCHGKDFGGGVIIDSPIVAYWAAPNLTSGQGSVTNGFSAHDWDLAVRHGIRHTGQSSSMPSKDFASVTDHELSDVIVYLKSRPPVDRLMPSVRLGPVFAFLVALDPKMLTAFTVDHQKPHAVEPPTEAVTLEFGAHLVESCRGCHQQNLAGGKVQGDPNMPIVANLTPDSTGLKGWTEADFVRALREGKRPNGTAIDKAMPWAWYRKMNDVEIGALWLYLQSLPPVPKGKRT